MINYFVSEQKVSNLDEFSTQERSSFLEFVYVWYDILMLSKRDALKSITLQTHGSAESEARTSYTITSVMLTPCGPMLLSLKLLVEKSFAC